MKKGAKVIINFLNPVPGHQILDFLNFFIKYNRVYISNIFIAIYQCSPAL